MEYYIAQKIDVLMKEAEAQPLDTYTGDIMAIKNDPQRLTQYIEYLLNTETSILSCQRRLGELLNEENLIQSKINSNLSDIKKQLPIQLQKQLNDSIASLNAIEIRKKNLPYIEKALENSVKKELIEKKASVLKKKYAHLTPPISPEPLATKEIIKPTLPVLKKIPLLISKKNRDSIKQENDLLMSEYQKAKAQYDEEQYRYTQAIKQYDQKIKQYDQEMSLYLEEKKQYDAELKRIELTLTDEEIRHEVKTRFEQQQVVIQKHYVEAKAKYDEAKAEYDHFISASQNSSNHALLVVRDEIQEATALLKKTVKTKNELYALNIVFGKYRNFVALCSFYEYLLSGRCSSLEGTGGAYNIYESEIRANRIISRLSDIISSLGQIQENQYLAYEKLQNIDSELEILNNKTDKALSALKNIGDYASSIYSKASSIADSSKATALYSSNIAQNTAVTAYNTARTAYYTQKNAELTNALGYLIALK